VTRFNNDEDENDLRNIISDTFLFLSIDLLCKKEADFKSLLLPIGEFDVTRSDTSALVCNGPYNHVTSQTFSLYNG